MHQGVSLVSQLFLQFCHLFMWQLISNEIVDSPFFSTTYISSRRQGMTKVVKIVVVENLLHHGTCSLIRSSSLLGSSLFNGIAESTFESDMLPCIKFKIFQPLDHCSIALRVLYVQAYLMGLYRQHLKVICSPCIKFKIFQPVDHGPIALRVLYVQNF